VTNDVAPSGATHWGEFYGLMIFYRLTHGTHYNTVIDHPQECWQKTDIWDEWDGRKWAPVGRGFSSRRLKRWA
jgi:hypothetical protein